MSAPNTNLQTEAKRHRPALIGISVAVIFAAVLFVAWIFFAISGSDENEEALIGQETEQAAAVDGNEDAAETEGDATISD